MLEEWDAKEIFKVAMMFHFVALVMYNVEFAMLVVSMDTQTMELSCLKVITDHGGYRIIKHAHLLICLLNFHMIQLKPMHIYVALNDFDEKLIY